MLSNNCGSKIVCKYLIHKFLKWLQRSSHIPIIFIWQLLNGLSDLRPDLVRLLVNIDSAIFIFHYSSMYHTTIYSGYVQIVWISLAYSQTDYWKCLDEGMQTHFSVCRYLSLGWEEIIVFSATCYICIYMSSLLLDLRIMCSSNRTHFLLHLSNLMQI